MRASRIQLRSSWLIASCIALMAVGIVMIRPHAHGLAVESPGDDEAAIRLSADWSQEWREGDATLALFRGSCRVTQGEKIYTSNSMVVWAHDPGANSVQRSHITVYLEEDVTIQSPAGTRSEQSLWIDLTSHKSLSLSVKGRVPNRPGKDDPLYRRAIARPGNAGRSNLRQTQLTMPSQATADPMWRPVQFDPPSGLRRVRISPRSLSMPPSIESFPSNNTTPPEQVTLITGGVNIVIDGIEVGGREGMGAVDITADRAVIWTETTKDGEPPSSLFQQRQETPLQVYLEGNIVIRQQSRLELLGNSDLNSMIRAERAFFDARENRALILNAELQTFAPTLNTSVRIRAERIRQNSEKSFHAQNAWITTSQLGQPGYRVQASDIYVEPRLTGQQVDPQTGAVAPREQFWVTALNSQLLVGEVPLFYVPQATVPIDETGTPLTGVGFGQDRIFGTQIRTRWDAFSLLGLDRPAGVTAKWNILADYLSLRGPALGTDGKYSGTDQYGNTFQGLGHAYYINDGGIDNLGRDRRAIPPANPNRGILQWANIYTFAPYNMQLLTEVGYQSDRNVRESFFEKDFDTGTDLNTRAMLRQIFDENFTGSVLLQPTVNNFENNTAWLPRGDLTSLAEPIFGDILNWSQHTSIGYAQLNQAVAPPNTAIDPFTPLAYYKNSSGLVTMTRHEVEAPFNLGPIKISPYLMGEAAYWGDSLTGQGIDRFYGRGGMRASLQFSRIFPTVQSDILNLNGLAHKVILDADYGYAQSSRSLSQIAQFNPFEDNAQERFRERFITGTFGGVLPPQFDPRFYAVRSQSATGVTDPYNELVDTQQALRLGLSQRLQTKVGPTNQQRIKDWMSLDLGVTYFPNATRDDFGSSFGLFSTRYTWNVGDRTTVVADSLYDFFQGGQEWWNIGVMNQRSYRGSVYVGAQQIKGTSIDSQVVTASYSYLMSPKWLSTMSTAYDIAQHQSRGQSLTITRVGEWMLFHFGANYDWSKNNASFLFSVEPKLGRAGTMASPTSGIGNSPGMQR